MHKTGHRGAGSFTLLALVSVGLTACGPQRLGEADLKGPVQSDLRITKVVLYQSGVGYFERRGRINTNVLSLRIRHDQVMDVLKSLTVVDRRAGGTVTVSLPAEKSRLMQVSQLPPQVRTSGGLLAIASAFRGATAVVRTDKGTFRGRIVGVENIGNEKNPDWRMTLIQNEAITAHRIADIRSIRVLDKTLTVGLSKSLDVALNKGRWKPVQLTVRLSGEPPHDLIVSYVVPMPTWKPAYRLVVGEQDEKKILLQGWSVVDNLSGEHWIKSKLSLTAGTPLAFKYDLYTPRDVDRPDLTPQGTQMAEAPPAPMDATAKEGERRPPAAGPMPKKAEPRPGAGGSRSYARRYRRSRRSPAQEKAKGDTLSGLMDARRDSMTLKDLQRSYKTLVSGTSVGSLFRYEIQKPVTVPDRSSALVSIINTPVAGSDVLYFLVGSGRSNPYRAVRFKNSTGYVLERGPITIYRKGAFVGEALGGRVEKDATAFVPYALEGRAIIHLSDSTRDEGLKLIKIRNGYLTVESQMVTRFTYKVVNRTDEALALYVGRLRRSGWKIVEPKNVILERTLYYAKIPLKQTGVTKFTVKETTPVKRTLSMYDYRSRRALRLYLKGAEVSAKLRAKLNKVMLIWDQIAALDTKMHTLKTSIAMLRRRQADIRENIKVLGRRGNQDLRRKLARSLADVERQLNELNRKWVVNNMKRGGLRQRLQVMFRMIRL